MKYRNPIAWIVATTVVNYSAAPHARDLGVN